jgi:hypothetical protein
MCSDACPLRATLSIAGKGVVADGATVAAPAGRLDLRVRAGAGRALRKARRAVLEAVAGDGPSRTASRAITLRR